MTPENKSKTTGSIINNESGKSKNVRLSKTFFQIECAAETCNDYFKCN